MSKKKKSIAGHNLVKVSVFPKTENQSIALAAENHLVMSGSAGTGKTFIGMSLAFDGMSTGDYNKLLIVRSIVPTTDIGFLPGTVAEKCSVYEAPYRQIANELFSRGDAYEILKLKGLVEFIPTSFVRGTTYDNTVMIIDEAQNLTLHELDSVATRVGKNTRLIVIGDYRQSDLPRNGLKEFLKILEHTGDFSLVEFQSEDIVRSGFVRRYIMARNELGL